MKRNLFFYLLAGVALFTACTSKEEPQTLPTLTTITVNTITENSALSGGNVSSDAGSVVTARGICWSVTANPTLDNFKIVSGVGMGAFQIALPNLIAGTSYYVRAYATNGNGTAYGNVVKFSTLALATPIRDTDGNVYQTVNIGTQTWMAENLRSTRFRTSESISNVTSDSLWSTATFSAWCNNNNDTINGRIYGRLYNYLAIIDPRNIAPLGWHVATQAEWTTLVTFLGGESVAGGKLKNSAGFNALLGGDRDPSGAFGEIGGDAYWWSATENSSTPPAVTIWYWYINTDKTRAYKYYDSKEYGMSVRCVKDKVQ